MIREWRLATASDVRAIERASSPATVPDFDTPLERLVALARSAPDAAALVMLDAADALDRQTVWSRATLVGHALALAAALEGIAARPVVGVVLPTCGEAVAAFLGAQSAGTCVAVNPYLEPRHVAALLESARADAVVVPGPALADRAQLSSEALVRAIDRLPGVRAIYSVGGRFNDPRVRLWPSPVPVASTAPRPRTDVAALFHTGGTTGRPKLARLTLGNLVFNVWVNGVVMPYDEHTCVLNGLALFHVSGMLVNTIGPLCWGGRVVLLTARGFREPAVVASLYRLVERHRATTLMAVPTVFERLLPVSVDADLSSLRPLTCGAAPANGAVLDAFERRTGVRVLEGYGLTEATVSVCRTPRDGATRRGSVGVHHPHVEVRVAQLTAEGGLARWCANAETGRVLVRGANVFAGYVGEPGCRLIEDEWLDTGDLGRFDGDEYL